MTKIAFGFDFHDTIVNSSDSWDLAFIEFINNKFDLEKVKKRLKSKESRRLICNEYGLDYFDVQKAYRQFLVIKNKSILDLIGSIKKSALSAFLISNSSSERLIKDLNKVKLLNKFDRIYSSRDGLKPDFEYFERIISRHEIDILFYIGNDPNEDLIKHEKVISFIVKEKEVETMTCLLEFCQSNLKVSGTESIKQLLIKNKDFILKEYECLGYCFECSDKPYVVINDEYVDDENVEALLKKINKKNLKTI
ncbi:Uncharacterized protein YuzB, UPF0349 family [Paenibacillaceae bacterium GAS479]|nr:Uncharacterized protein YuzB, UPF0349 family [Paenibacillaceae bacterium GAS479]